MPSPAAFFPVPADDTLAPGVRQRFYRFAAAYVVVWVLTWYSSRLMETLGVTSLWYLPAGLRFACLLALGRVGLGLELLTSSVLMVLRMALSSYPEQGMTSLQWLDLLFNVAAFPCAYALVVFPLRWHLPDGLDLARTRDSVVFVLAALCASGLAAAAGTVNLVRMGTVAPADWRELFFSWLIGDLIGVLTLAPLLLVRVWPALQRYLHHGHFALQHRAHKARSRLPEDVAIVLIVGCSVVVVMGLPHLLGYPRHSPMVALVLLLPLAAVALRYQLRGAMLAAALMGAGLVLMVTLLEHGADALPYQLEMVAIALVGLWLGGTVEARDQLIQRLKDFTSVSNDLLWETDRAGEVRFSGRLAEQITVPSGAHWRTLLEPVVQPSMPQIERARLQRQPFSRLEVALPMEGAAARWLSVSGLPLWDSSGEYAGYRGTATDITDAVRVKALLEGYNQQLLQDVAQSTAELKRTNSELSLKEQHLSLLLSTVPVGVLEFDAQGRCQYINANGSALCGMSMPDAQGRHLVDFVHPEDHEVVAAHWETRAQHSAVQSMEFRLKGKLVWCSAYWVQFRQADAHAACTIMVLADSSLQHQHAAQLWTLAHTDLLTGLPNRSLFLDRCAQALTQARRRDRSVAVFLLDLDGFKSVNDTLGHAAGDALLQQVAQRLRQRVRDSDTVARIGGDEFAVVISEVATPASAEQVALELVSSLAKPYVLPQGSCQVSASLGIALYAQHAADVETLLQYADMAMYSAKNAGKNRVQLWRPASPNGLAQS